MVVVAAGVVHFLPAKAFDWTAVDFVDREIAIRRIIRAHLAVDGGVWQPVAVAQRWIRRCVIEGAGAPGVAEFVVVNAEDGFADGAARQVVAAEIGGGKRVGCTGCFGFIDARGLVGSVDIVRHIRRAGVGDVADRKVGVGEVRDERVVGVVEFWKREGVEIVVGGGGI